MPPSSASCSGAVAAHHFAVVLPYGRDERSGATPGFEIGLGALRSMCVCVGRKGGLSEINACSEMLAGGI